MSLTNLLSALFIALGAVSWPIIIKYSQASAVWAGTLVFAGTTLAVALLYNRQLLTQFPSGRAVLLLAIAAAINGTAMYVYSLKAADPKISTGLFVVMISVLAAVLAPFLDWILNSSTPTARQMGGIFLAVVSLYLLGR